jgi:urease accessory protein
MHIAPKHFGQAGLATLTLFAATQASAHHPMGGQTPETFWQGMLSGIGHPVIGLDHLAFIVVVGLLAFALGSRAGRLIVPGVFALATVAGALAHVQAAALPMVETVVALSVLLGGLLVAARVELSTLLLALGVAGFGLFHGFAYGEAIIGAESTPLVAYLGSFALTQFALISGMAFGLTALAARSERLPRVIQGTGAAAAVGGGALLALNLA